MYLIYHVTIITFYIFSTLQKGSVLYARGLGFVSEKTVIVIELVLKTVKNFKNNLQHWSYKYVSLLVQTILFDVMCTTFVLSLGQPQVTLLMFCNFRVN